MNLQELHNAKEQALGNFRQCKATLASLGEEANELRTYIQTLRSNVEKDPELLYRLQAAVMRLEQCHNQIRQIEEECERLKPILHGLMEDAQRCIAEAGQKISALKKSISVMEAAAGNMFGANATSQVPMLNAQKEKYVFIESEAQNIFEEIQQELDGEGNPQEPQKTLKYVNKGRNNHGK